MNETFSTVTLDNITTTCPIRFSSLIQKKHCPPTLKMKEDMFALQNYLQWYTVTNDRGNIRYFAFSISSLYDGGWDGWVGI